jgi:hypothetical protein
VNDQFIGCSVCKKVGVMALNKKKNVHLFSNWHAFLVMNNGSTIANQPSSPRRKFERNHSLKHPVPMVIEKRMKEKKTLKSYIIGI